MCHGGDEDTVHRVCLVDDEGSVKAAYSGHQLPLRSPAHLAATDAGFVLVLDVGNKRIVLLDPDLGHIRDVVDAGNGLSEPRRTFWDDVNSRLYVAENSGNIVVFELMP